MVEWMATIVSLLPRSHKIVSSPVMDMFLGCELENRSK